MTFKRIFIIVAIMLVACAYIFNINGKRNLPIVAIVSYGPIPPMEASINGIKKELSDSGFVENKTVRYAITDICFDHTLIPQTITSLKDCNPTVIIATATAIAQFAKRKIQDIPLVYSSITNPVEAGLIKDKAHSNENVTGSSDMQNLDAFLAFAKSILPKARTIGLLYSTSDSNDSDLINMMNAAALTAGMSVLAIPIDQIRDIPIRMQSLKGKADFIYIGASGLQSTLPTIASEAQKLSIPVFNMEEQAVRDGFALASFGVNYESVGKNAGKLVVKLLNGAHIRELTPIYPTISDHQLFINRRQAKKFRINIPKNAIVVE